MDGMLRVILMWLLRQNEFHKINGGWIVIFLACVMFVNQRHHSY